jgi:hypothetical protein
MINDKITVKSINLFFLMKIKVKQFNKNYLTAKIVNNHRQCYNISCLLPLQLFRSEVSQ